MTVRPSSRAGLTSALGATPPRDRARTWFRGLARKQGPRRSGSGSHGNSTVGWACVADLIIGAEPSLT